jgi:serine/threonine protein kinase
VDGDKPQFSRGDVIAGKYEVEKVLGSGLIGTTYLVRNQKSRKFLAVKVIWPQLVKTDRDRTRLTDLFQEAKGIDGASLIKLGSVTEGSDATFFTEEYFPSQSLRELIDEYQAEPRSFTLQEACQIIIKVLEAVEVVHKAGTIHRNLKPENVLVSTRRTGPGGRNLVRTIKVSDGLLSDLVNPTIFAESYVSRADAKYLAPEMTGFDDIGAPSTDIYSVGVMLYELLVGQPPRGTYLSPTQLRGDLPEHIDDVIENALGESPEERYPSARDMIVDIQRSFSEETSHAPRGPDVKNVAIGVAVGVAILGLLGTYFSMREPPKQNLSALTKDNILRNGIASRHRQLSEAEIEKMIESHPEMQYIPEGPFVMGRLHQEAQKGATSNEPLAQERELPSFYIDRFENPNIQKNIDGSAPKPTVKVAWAQANAACESQGKRLCTENEWEKACKGPDNFIYAYGDGFDEVLCGNGGEFVTGIVSGFEQDDILVKLDSTKPKGRMAVLKKREQIPSETYREGDRIKTYVLDTTPSSSAAQVELSRTRPDYRIGSFKDCVTGYGVYGMSGGAREWTSTGKGSAGRRVVKGGMKANHKRGSRCAFSMDESGGYADASLSFRCCLDAASAPEPAPAKTDDGAKTPAE